MSALGAAGLALYSGEFARHEIEVVHRDIYLDRLPPAFEGVHIVQLSDIHLDEFTEPYFLRRVLARVNELRPDYIFLTGDYVTAGVGRKRIGEHAAWQCGGMLRELTCTQRYASLGNHDHGVGDDLVTEALASNGTPVLRNAFLPIERNGARIWLAGLADPLEGKSDPERAVPASIRNQPSEPVILLCHAPDYVDRLLKHPAAQSIDLMLSGHTHGGQVRLPLVGALALPHMGRKYVQGAFQFGRMQMYVNRGIGAVGVPFRLNCPPEITSFVLHAGPHPQPAALQG